MNTKKGLLEKKQMNKKFKEEVIELLNKNVSLEKIYEKLHIDFPELAPNKAVCMRNIDTLVLADFGYDKFKKYFTDLYLDKYNNEMRWENPGYAPIWHNLKIEFMITDRKTAITKCAREAMQYILENKLYIPKDFCENIDKCFKERKPFELEGLKEHKKIGTSKYIEWYLFNKYSQEEIKSYLQETIVPEMKKEKLIKSEITKKYFGVESGFSITLPKLSELITEVRGAYNYRPVKKEWCDSHLYLFEWYNYTREQIDQKLEEVNQIFLRDRDIFAKHRILEKLYGISEKTSKNEYIPFFVNHPDSEYVVSVINKYSETQPYELIKCNSKNMVMGLDEWALFSEYRNGIHKKILSFEKIDADMKADIQQYYKTIKLTHNLIIRAGEALLVIRKLIEKYNIKTFEELTEEKLQLWAHECINKGIKGSSLNGNLTAIRWLYKGINTLPKYKKKKLKNVAEFVTIKNVEKNTVHASSIPPEIAVQIDSYVDELDDMSKIMYKIMRESGVRFGDQFNSSKNDVVLEKNDNTCARFYYLESKVYKRRIENNKYEKQFVHIPRELYDEIMDYIEKTEWIRVKYNVNDLFVNVNNRGRICSRTAGTVTNKINNLIDKYDIKTTKGETWHYHNRQLRKTVAVDLITNGASLYNVKSALKHTSERTTEIYYAEVEKMKILELNTEFFNQKFKLFITDETLKEYTEEERQILYLDFLQQQRTVEFGYCCKHPSEGMCCAQTNNSCASCSKLITGKKFIDKWEVLLNDTIKVIEELERIYDENNIPYETYKNFREYSREIEVKNKYQAVIGAIYEIEEKDGE